MRHRYIFVKNLWRKKDEEETCRNKGIDVHITNMGR